MGLAVCGGALLQCPFGVAPSVLNVLPINRTVTSMPLANIMDNKPMVNISPFGLCNSLSNPTVAAATSAALGVLTPMPCVPNIAAPWAPGCPTACIANQPALTDASKCACLWGGVISINFAGQTTIQLP